LRQLLREKTSARIHPPRREVLTASEPSHSSHIAHIVSTFISSSDHHRDARRFIPCYAIEASEVPRTIRDRICRRRRIPSTDTGSTFSLSQDEKSALCARHLGSIFRLRTGLHQGENINMRAVDVVPVSDVLFRTRHKRVAAAMCIPQNRPEETSRLCVLQ
jgi:hypothetical protein